EVPGVAESGVAEEVTEPPAAYVEVDAEEVIEVPEIAEIEIAEDIPEVCAEAEAEEIAEVPETAVTEDVPETVAAFFEVETEVIPEVPETAAIENVPEVPAIAVTGKVQKTLAAFFGVEAKVPEITVTEIAEKVAEVPETAATEDVPETVAAFFEIETEDAAVIEPAAEIDVPEAIEATPPIEIEKEVPDVIMEARTEEVAAEEETAVQLPPADRYLMEIEDDAPSADITDAREDDAEESNLALLNGIAVEGGIIMTEDAPEPDPCVDAYAFEAPAPAVGMNAVCADAPVTAADEAHEKALAICFSFRSEGLPPAPAASMRFVWGQR
ncbi:MAG: hypothetical protein LBH69_05510, partial [Methanomassiliicoccaceae archaeon]|nr:hypothetical protein [Methanomassiliicoccaceae archaeon]